MQHTKKFSLKKYTLWFILAAVLILAGVGGYFAYDKIYLNYTATPVLTLLGDETVTLEAGTPYTEAGAAATVRDRDITDTIQVNTPDVSALGTHQITYTVTNLKGKNAVTLTRTVIVQDTIAPEIVLNGGNASLYVGDTYEEQGATATDSFEGDLTATVKTEGKVDTAKAGTYTITYTVADSSGNTASVSRTVLVKTKVVDVTIQDNGNGKVVYLTFDDGPSPRTIEVLDILKKYDAKATFFVVGNSMSKYGYLLKRMVAEGHTVALHSNTHNYAKIYAGTDAFWADQAALGEKVKAQIGYVPKIFRFPGGGSNTVSRKYCSGVMSALVSQAAQKGLLYYDWNISSGDASSSNPSATTIANNVIRGINKGYKTPIVLMHDAAAKYNTVAALETILKQGTASGYVFAAMTESTATVHQKVQN